jgi:plasmid stabilization system protein ParE
VETDLFKVQWTKRARKNYAKIINEIAKDAPLRAVEFGRRLQEAAASLCWSPWRCPPTTEYSAHRHLIFKRYRIIFKIDEDRRIVSILRVLFPYQQYRPQIFKDDK